MGICGLALFKEIGIEKFAIAFASDISGDRIGVSSMPSYVPSKQIYQYFQLYCNVSL